MKSLAYYILSLILMLQILGLNPLFAQVKVYVVSQNINKSIDWQPGMTLQINAERAEILCSAHANNTIEIEVTIIAKHESKVVAESDLKKMKWLNEVKGKKVFLRNYIELSRNESRPESDIKVVYNIKVPENCAVDISNYFGNIEVKNLNSKLKINSEFSKIDLLNISGKLTVKTTFGDVLANKINGELHIESKRSNINIYNFEGILDIKSKVAEIELNEIDKITEINIDAEKSKIKINTRDFNSFFFKLDLYKVELEKPEAMKLNFSKNEKGLINASFNNPDKYPQIEIELNIGTLKIEP